ncbi:MAG: TetR/AcrR family transcriptional regulator [Spirochaetales bacterium]|nr:TetR/AcrR family transcriptional regulator [Spirochaetales bacterium]
MTKNEILASILPLASKEGLRNLSLSKIAENAGIAKSTLYSHFDSKDDMIDQLYLYLREKAKERMHIGVVDYGNIVKGKSLEEVLLYVVSSYDSINRDSDMKNFYAIIESEKAFSNIAARIITEETETMFTATKNLFYALEAEKIAHFPSIENAALLFAQSVHSTLTLMQDDETAGTEVSKGILEKIIHEFSNLYRIKKE